MQILQNYNSGYIKYIFIIAQFIKQISVTLFVLLNKELLNLIYFNQFDKNFSILLILNHPFPALMRNPTMLYCILVCLHLPIQQALSQQYQTSALCKNEPKQSANQRWQQYTPYTYIQNAVESMFTANKTLFWEGVMQKDNSKILKSIEGNTHKYVINIGSVCLLAAIFVVLVPVLLFTKCCKCAPCNKNKSDKLFTRFQLSFPGIASIFGLVLLIAICAVIIRINHQYQKSYDDFTCSLSSISSDLVGGSNITLQSQKITKFEGIMNYKQKLQNMYASLQKIRDIVAQNLHVSLSQQFDTIYRLHIKLQKMSEKLISDRDYRINLRYRLSFYERQQKVAINSTFPLIFGQTNRSNTLVANYNASLNESILSLKNLSLLTQRFWENSDLIDKNSIDSHLQKSIALSHDIQKSYQNFLADIIDIPSLRRFSVGSYIVLSLTLLLILIMIIGIGCMIYKTKFQCRIPICLCCIMMWTIGVLHFMMAIAFTINNPTVYYSCQNIKQSFASQQRFGNYFRHHSENGALLTMQKCLYSSKSPYYFYQNILSKDQQSKIQNVRDLLSISFDGQSYSENIQDKFQQILRVSLMFRNGLILDVDNAQAIQQIRNLSLTEECFPDSWFVNIPENNFNINCSLNQSNRQISNNETCKTVQDFISRAPGCSGCMDIFSFFSNGTNFSQTRSRMLNNLNQRYPLCVQMNKTRTTTQKIVNFYNKYIYFKLQKFSKMLIRYENMKPDNQQLTELLKRNINSSLAKVQNIILQQPAFQDFQNSKIKQNMDCRVLGKALQRSHNILCSQATAYVFYLRIFYTISSSLILIICLITVCLMNRFRLQWQIKKHKNQEQQQNYQEQDIEIQNNQLKITSDDRLVYSKTRNPQRKQSQQQGQKVKDRIQGIKVKELVQNLQTSAFKQVTTNVKQEFEENVDQKSDWKQKVNQYLNKSKKKDQSNIQVSSEPNRKETGKIVGQQDNKTTSKNEIDKLIQTISNEQTKKSIKQRIQQLRLRQIQKLRAVSGQGQLKQSNQKEVKDEQKAEQQINNLQINSNYIEDQDKQKKEQLQEQEIVVQQIQFK